MCVRAKLVIEGVGSVGLGRARFPLKASSQDAFKTKLGLNLMPVLFAGLFSPAGSQTQRRIQEGR